MAYLFLGSLSFGLVYAQVCNNERFLQIYHGIYRPHRDHRQRVREVLKQGGALNINHYKLYFVDALFSPIIMIQSFFYKYKTDLKIYKQQMIYDLVEKFEFVNETIDNFDEINELVKTKSKTSPHSYSNMNQKEKVNQLFSEVNVFKDKLAMLKSLSDSDENSSDFERKVYAEPKIDNSKVSPQEKFETFIYNLNQKKKYNELYNQEVERIINEQDDEINELFLKKQREYANPQPKTAVFENPEDRRKRLEHEEKMSKFLKSEDPKTIENIKEMFNGEKNK